MNLLSRFARSAYRVSTLMTVKCPRTRNTIMLFGVGTAIASLTATVYAATKDESLFALPSNGFKVPGTGIYSKDALSNNRNKALADAINRAREIALKIKEEKCCPGLVVGVSVNGESVWEEGFGFSDVENLVPCKPQTVMRIASISKPITAALVARLWERGQVDLNKDIREYVSYWPKKEMDGKEVTITSKQLLSHMSGVRHYSKTINGDSRTMDEKLSDARAKSGDGDAQFYEFLIMDKFDTTEQAVGLFKDDPLLFPPGTRYFYTTYGFTLLSAVVEGVTRQSFRVYLRKSLDELGLNHTYLDMHEPLIANRAKYYFRSKSGSLVNAPYVDNSCKWAGGGLLSTVGDLLKFGNIMLYCLQADSATLPSQTNASLFSPVVAAFSLAKQLISPSASEKPVCTGFLSSQTVQEMWKPIIQVPNHEGSFYGLGWGVVIQPKDYTSSKREQRTLITHSGGAVGASSVLLIVPGEEGLEPLGVGEEGPKGIVVSMIGNMLSVGLSASAKEIARLFEEFV